MDDARLIGPLRIRWPAPDGVDVTADALVAVVGTQVGLAWAPKPDGIMTMSIGDPGPGRMTGVVTICEVVDDGAAVELTIDVGA